MSTPAELVLWFECAEMGPLFISCRMLLLRRQSSCSDSLHRTSVISSIWEWRLVMGIIKGLLLRSSAAVCESQAQTLAPLLVPSVCSLISVPRICECRSHCHWCLLQCPCPWCTSQWQQNKTLMATKLTTELAEIHGGNMPLKERKIIFNDLFLRFFFERVFTRLHVSRACWKELLLPSSIFVWRLSGFLMP